VCRRGDLVTLAIDRFELRIARRGWIAGDAERTIAAAAKQLLPAAIATRIDEITGGTDAEITEPVRLSIRVKVGELVTACGNASQLAILVARWLPAVESSVVRAAQASSAGDDPNPNDAQTALVALLSSWHVRGDLGTMLDIADADALEVWHRTLLAGSPFRPDRALEAPATAALASCIASARHESYGNPRAGALRWRIAATIAAVSQLGISPGNPQLAAQLDERAPLPREGTRARATAAMPAGPRRASARLHADHSNGAIAALPFLLLEPLRRIGYIEAVVATFAAAERSEDIPAFATALAYKVLAPPERGWRRLPYDVETAAAFAGLVDPIAEAALATFADSASSLLAPLDAVIGRAVLAGHARTRPLLLVAIDGDRLVVEPDGLFPIAWSDGLDVLRGCRALVAVPAATAEPELLARLDELGVRFATDAPPTRRERWSRVAGRAALWSNDAWLGPADIAATLDCVALATDVAELASTFAVRPAALFARVRKLDRSVTLAAGVALAQIASELWSKRELTSPTLALARFGDLTLSRSSLSRFRLPLGRRRDDLRTHHLLGRMQAFFGEVDVE
jgi:hypothetical protein